ncbi:MAG: hypothetical protein COB37_06280 [Kordiimonadales bacterium]|nr:MAG: hypothetical protein COB37_06280 [Kordiimonadales bacterium]
MHEETASSAPASASGSRFSFAAIIDLIAVLATLVIVKQTVLPFSYLYAGPASTFSAMALGTYLLRRRGLSWADLGLRWPKSWLKTVGLAVLTFFAFAISMELTETVADMFFENVGASGRFDHVEGNWSAYLIIMVLTWTHASFFEELLFRAFFINRASSFLGGGLRADLIAVVLSAIFFGYRHFYYQGMNGALKTGAAGLVLGLLYLWFGRKNIMPLVLSHGVMNSLGMTMRFLGMRGD